MLRIATRKSPLALAQAEAVARALAHARPGIRTVIVGVSTRGDDIADQPLANIGGKELFVKNLQAQLLANRADLAVHSLKDMGPTPPASADSNPLVLAAVGFAQDPRDAVVSRENLSLHQLPDGAVVGTSSPRRTALLGWRFPKLQARPIRGNLQTRIAKLHAGECDALVLAVAGLRRIGLESHICEILPADFFIPAVGQGLLAVECADPENAAIAAAVDDPAARIRAVAERAFSAAIAGDCRTPMGARAVLENGQVKIRAFLAVGEKILQAQAESPQSAPEQSGKFAAAKILAQARK